MQARKHPHITWTTPTGTTIIDVSEVSFFRRNGQEIGIQFKGTEVKELRLATIEDAQNVEIAFLKACGVEAETVE